MERRFIIVSQIWLWASSSRGRKKIFNWKSLYMETIPPFFAIWIYEQVFNFIRHDLRNITEYEKQKPVLTVSDDHYIN